jgi:hypothetical protein
MKSKRRKGRRRRRRKESGGREGQGELGILEVRLLLYQSVFSLNFSTYDVRCPFNVDSFCNMAEWHNITHVRLNVES